MVKWNLNDVHKLNERDKLITKLKKNVEELKKSRKKLNKSLNVNDFMKIIKKSESISEISSKLAGYVGLKLTEKTNSSKLITEEAIISELLTHLGNELIFFSIWFKKLDNKQADKYISKAGKYAYYLKEIRSARKFTLTEPEEKIINLKDLTGSDAVIKTYDIITNSFKFNWKGKEITQGELVTKVQTPKKEDRHEAYQTLFKKYNENSTVLGEIYKTIVQDWKNENITVRGFKSPISVRNLSNDLNDKIVESLLNVVKKNTHVFQEYFKLKAKILNEKKLSRYDLYAPIKTSTKKYTYEQSKKIVLGTFKEFSPLAYTYAKEIFDLKHVHSEVQPGKQSGAFCYTVNKDISPYVLMNYTDTLKDLMTMMHEFGHGIHGRAARNQTQFTFHSSLPLAETASIFSETILENKLLKEASKKEKKSLLMYALENQYASIQRQSFFVIFEKDAHDLIAKGATVEELDKLYMKNLKLQFGNSLEIPDEFKHEWKYIPHIFHTPFYCYAYAFGNLLGLALAQIYEEQGDKFVNNFMKVLATGGGDSSYNNLKKNLNIDISKESFWQKAFDYISKEVEELKDLI